jgi:hypothetical protein
VYGSPSCADWWNNSSSGLKKRLYGALPANFLTEFKDVFSSNNKLQEDSIKRIVSNGGGDYSSPNPIENTQDMGTKLLANVGLIYSQLEGYPTIYAISQAAPLVQALLLLMAFAFLPFVLVFSGYKPATFITGAIVIFSLFFWSYIWHLIGWVDSTLMLAFFNDSWFNLRSPNETLLIIIIGFLQIVAPLFWFGYMSALGVAARGLFSALSSSVTQLVSGPAENAGNSGANLAKMAASMGYSKIESVANELKNNK